MLARCYKVQQLSLTSDYFNANFIPKVGPYGHFSIRVTHEFYPNQKTITIGTYEGRKVAIKQGWNMKSEINIHKKIKPHPNIVEFITEVIIDEETSYFMMQGVDDGTNLMDWIYNKSKEFFRRNESTSLTDAEKLSENELQTKCLEHKLKIKVGISLIQQIAKGLQHLHNQGIIHHDLKPENILIDDSEGILSIKLCDFEIAEFVDEQGYGKSENRSSGTYLYMAPNKLIQNFPIYLSQPK